MCLKPERLWQVAVSSSLLCCRCRSASRSCCMAAMRQDSMPCPTEKHVQSASCWDVVFFFLFVYVLFFLTSNTKYVIFFPACFPWVTGLGKLWHLQNAAFVPSLPRASSAAARPLPWPKGFCKASTWFVALGWYAKSKGFKLAKHLKYFTCSL